MQFHLQDKIEKQRRDAMSAIPQVSLAAQNKTEKGRYYLESNLTNGRVLNNPEDWSDDLEFKVDASYELSFPETNNSLVTYGTGALKNVYEEADNVIVSVQRIVTAKEFIAFDGGGADANFQLTTSAATITGGIAFFVYNTGPKIEPDSIVWKTASGILSVITTVQLNPNAEIIDITDHAATSGPRTRGGIIDIEAGSISAGGATVQAILSTSGAQIKEDYEKAVLADPLNQISAIIIKVENTTKSTSEIVLARPALI